MRVRFPLEPLKIINYRVYLINFLSLKTISIALCTYNGSKFLREQLQSIANQKLLPNEVIITDDCSSDDTEEIIKEFISLLNITFIRNSYPLKVTKNFEKAISLCTSDIIMPCDQDDIWYPKKLSTIHNYFEKHPKKLAVFTNAELIDEKGQSLNQYFWQKVRLGSAQIKAWKEDKALDINLHGNRVAGCMLAFRKELLTYCQPFPTFRPPMIHDGWLTLVACMFNEIGLIEKPLIAYRQHQNQQVGTRPVENGKVLSLKERLTRPRTEKIAPFIQKRDEYFYLKTILEQYLSQTNNPIVASNFKKIEAVISFYETRASLSAFHLARVFPVTKLLLSGAYHRYKDQEASSKAPFIAALGDLFE